MMLTHAHVIDLPSSRHRLVHAEAELDRLGLASRRVDAIDGRQMTAGEVAAGHDGDRARAYMGRAMLPGELGCHLSHCRALEAFLATDEEVALVFEDDLRLSDDAPVMLDRLPDWIAMHPALRWHVIHLGPDRRKITTTLDRLGSHEIVRAHHFPQLAHALLWNRAGAEAFLEAARPIFCPADTMLRHVMVRSDMGLAVYPALASQADMFDSEIDHRPVRGGGRTRYARPGSRVWPPQRRQWVIAMRNRIMAPHGREVR